MTIEYQANFRRWATIPQAAEYTGLSPTSVRRLISGGHLTAHRPVKGRVLIDLRELDGLIESSTSTPRRRRGIRLA
ncbi:helix-turn-helix domain-containing protein [bacterium]|nr:helix-turn-helix domain-containing protein [bacterium]